MKRSTGRLIFVMLLFGAVGLLWYRHESREHSQDEVILQAARRYGVEPALVKAVVWRESRFDPSAAGRAGEIGLMQVTEIAATEWIEAAGISNFNPNSLYDPRTNTLAGTFYLARALKRYTATDNPALYALAEYNAGRSRVLRWMKDTTNSAGFRAQIDFPGTRAYVEQVLGRREHYRPAFPSLNPTPVNAEKH